MKTFTALVSFITRVAAQVNNLRPVLLATCLLVAVVFYGSKGTKPVTGAKQKKQTNETTAVIECDPGELQATPALFADGPSQYLYSDAYGWFDNNHFNAGNPHQVIEDVRATVGRGGGIISIRQSVRNGITGHTAHYLVSSDVGQAEVLSVALGIYMDWSYRFEAWQGSMPRSLAGPLTAFAIEDLPSHYVGFFAAATGLEVVEVLTCYLGGVEPTDVSPPQLLFSDDPESGSLVVPIRRLVNRKFTPMVQTEEGWQNVSWPAELQLPYLDGYSGLWAFEQEETWYFNSG